MIEATNLLIDQHKVQVIADGKLLANFAHGRSELEAGQEKPDRNGFAWKKRREKPAMIFLNQDTHP